MYKVLKHTRFAFELFAMNATLARPTLTNLHGKLSQRLTGLPYLADRAIRRGGSPQLLCKRDQNMIRNYMDRRVTPPRRVTSPGGLPHLPGVPHLHVNRPLHKEYTIDRHSTKILLS